MLNALFLREGNKRESANYSRRQLLLSGSDQNWNLHINLGNAGIHRISRAYPPSSLQLLISEDRRASENSLVRDIHMRTDSTGHGTNLGLHGHRILLFPKIKMFGDLGVGRKTK